MKQLNKILPWILIVVLLCALVPSAVSRVQNEKENNFSLILNLSYGATEKLIFPGRVITAAKRAICFHL